MKTYPTYDVMGFLFGMDRSTVCVNLKQILPTLKLLSPKREIKTIEDLKDSFNGDIINLILDGTERRYFRNKDYKKQKENYSGKKSNILKKIG